MIGIGNSALSTVKIDELKMLKGMHESRNALIARTLREIGYVREMGEGMRRIYSLMRDADLVAPDLASSPGRFTIILKHKSVFSDADQRWLDGFAPFKLTREEMLVMLLGREGGLISPQQIYDRLELVDWDVYRVIIEGMQAKGLLQNAISEIKKKTMAKRKGVSQREIPRIIIRQPEECEKAVKELFEVVGANSTSQIDNNYLVKIKNLLPPENIYALGGGNVRFSQTLVKLGLIGEGRTPTSSLVSLWKSRSTSKQPQPVSISGRIQTQSPRHSVVRPHPLPRKPPIVTNQTITKSAELFVGNVNYAAKEEEIIEFFSQSGTVVSVKMPIDFYSGKGRGFAFVCMANLEQAHQAIQQLNGQPFKGWPVRVNFYKPKS